MRWCGGAVVRWWGSGRIDVRIDVRIHVRIDVPPPTATIQYVPYERLELHFEVALLRQLLEKFAIVQGDGHHLHL